MAVYLERVGNTPDTATQRLGPFMGYFNRFGTFRNKAEADAYKREREAEEEREEAARKD